MTTPTCCPHCQRPLAREAAPTRTMHFYRQLRPVLSRAQDAWVDVEAARSGMTAAQYLTALVEDYEGHPVGAIPVADGPTMQASFGLVASTHTWLKSTAADLGDSMAGVVRWMIDREMGGGA